MPEGNRTPPPAPLWRADAHVSRPGWLDNDWVNFLATTMGAVLAALAFSGFSG